MGVSAADLPEHRSVALILELFNGVSAEEAKTIFFGELVPELFKFDDRLLIMVFQQDVHHLTVDPKTGIFFFHLTHDCSDDGAELGVVRFAIDHEPRENFMGV